MKKLLLLTKTLLAVVLLCVGQNAWGATETYDFSNYVVTENLGYSTGRDLTLTGDNIATADASTVKLVSGVSSGTSFDFGGRFAIQSTTLKFRNGNSQSKATTYKVNKGIQYATSSGTNHFSILNLKGNDIVTITTGNGTTKFASTNAKVGGSQVTYNQRVGSDATTGNVGSTTVCTMTEDGNLDLIMEEWAVIMSVTINNDTHSVEEGDIVSDGTTVNDVYGITMTYHGNWTYSYVENRGGSLVSGTCPTGSTNNIPDDGMYLIFTPHVTGQLQANVNIYGNHGTWYLVDKDNGHVFKTWSSKKDNDYTNLKDFGTIVEGHTYYLYGLGCDWGYQFHSFKFTPKDNDIISYVVNTTEIVNVGSEIDYVPGITMTYGGAAESTWSKSVTYTHNSAENSGNNASLTDGIPTSGTFVKFTPSVNGILRVGSIGYSTSKTCSVKLTDGKKTETITHEKGESNSYKDDTFETILASGTTYYVYFSGGGYNSKFCDFSFEKIPSTVTATIGSNGFTTFASPYPLDLANLPDGLEAYTATLAGTTLSFTPQTTAVAAGTGLLLKGANDTAYNIPVVASGSNVEGNALIGVTNSTTSLQSVENGTYYFVMKKAESASDALSFAPISTSTAVTMPSGKAYVVLPAENNARALRISFGDITGVASVEAAAEAKAQDGKFIENGKIVIIKNGKKYNANGQQVK